MTDRKEQIQNTIDKVQEVVDLFYQQNDKDALGKFVVTLEDMTSAKKDFMISPLRLPFQSPQ